MRSRITVPSLAERDLVMERERREEEDRMRYALFMRERRREALFHSRRRRLSSAQEFFLQECDRFTLVQPVFGTIEIEAMPAGDDVVIRVFAVVRNRVSGEPLELTSGHTIISIHLHDVEHGRITAKAFIGQIIHQTIMELMQHELSECIAYDGALLRDPHVERR